MTIYITSALELDIIDKLPGVDSGLSCSVGTRGVYIRCAFWLLLWHRDSAITRVLSSKLVGCPALVVVLKLIVFGAYP